MNLIGNAIKFTSSGSVRLVASSRALAGREHQVTYAIEDTGIGIAKQAQARIFDRFGQADSSTNRRFGGTGLGSPSRSHIVDLMGGRLCVESEPGRGSRFWFTIPAVEAEPAAENGDAGARREPRSRPGTSSSWRTTRSTSWSSSPCSGSAAIRVRPWAAAWTRSPP